MLDDDARRALEQEAIALVNLSNSQPLHTKKRPAPLTAAEAVVLAPKPKRLRPPHPQQDVHSLLRHNNTPMARRADSRAPHSHRGLATTAGASHKPLLAHHHHDHQDERHLSMSVFVSGDGNMSVVSTGGRGSPHHHHAAFERDPVVLKSPSPTSTTTTTADAHISMQSLLVTLNKRNTDDANDMAPPAATRLPRFRDVFDPSFTDRSPVATIQLQTPAVVSYSAAPSPSPVPSPSSPPATTQDVLPPAVEDLPYPPPPELKCKYRTGKCGNQRALKSCGDYHNLCNYHRLRANANQRKLDRKKKVQRVQPGLGDGSSEEGAPSPIAAAPTTTASAVATTLASLPSSSFLVSRSGAPPSRDGRHFLPYLVPPPSSSSSSSSMVRPKPC